MLQDQLVNQCYIYGDRVHNNTVAKDNIFWVIRHWYFTNGDYRKEWNICGHRS